MVVYMLYWYLGQALIPTFCVIGNRPLKKKKNGKFVDMFLIDYEMHQSVMELQLTLSISNTLYLEPLSISN